MYFGRRRGRQGISEFQFRKVNHLGDGWGWKLYSNVNVPSATELYSSLFSPWVVSRSLQPPGLRMPAFLVLHYVLEFAQTRAHWWLMTSSHLILCHPFLLLPSIFPSSRVFINELALPIRWPKHWSFSIIPSSEHSGLISFRGIFRKVFIEMWSLDLLP